MSKAKNKFNCDVNGSIMVTAALRYALGRNTYVPGAVIDWINAHWENLDGNTKTVIVRDVFEYLYKDYCFRNDAKFTDVAGDYDLKNWEKFGIENYWKLEYNERKDVDQQINSNKERSVWFVEKLYGTQPI